MVRQAHSLTTDLSTPNRAIYWIDLALTATAAVLRQWPATSFGVATCLLLLAAVWPQWSPPTGKAQAGAPVVTLYSANLHYRNRDLPRIAASIAW